jgi:hypothetical protein
MANSRVSIIILNWNGWNDTIECLARARVREDSYEDGVQLLLLQPASARAVLNGSVSYRHPWLGGGDGFGTVVARGAFLGLFAIFLCFFLCV